MRAERIVERLLEGDWMSSYFHRQNVPAQEATPEDLDEGPFEIGMTVRSANGFATLERIYQYNGEPWGELSKEGISGPGYAPLRMLRPVPEGPRRHTENKVDSGRVVEYYLGMPFIQEALLPPEIPDWLAGVFYTDGSPGSEQKNYENYLRLLHVVYIDSQPYRVDTNELWLLPMRGGSQAYRFDDEDAMTAFMAEHGEEGVDVFSHSHGRPDTKVASIPMEEREPHVVYRSGDYVFLKLPEDEEFIRKEGVDMQHCLAVAHRDYCARMRNKEIDVYSMTDAKTGIPVVDIEVALTRSSYHGPVEKATVSQLRGIRNECPPRDKYLEPVMDFLENYGKDWQIVGGRSFDGRVDGQLFLDRLAQLRSQGHDTGRPS